MNYKIDDFVGKTIKLITVDHEIQILGKLTIVKNFNVDSECPVVKELSYVFENIRFRPPGTMVTCDYNPTRMNVMIDKTGIITRMNFG